jgi:valyl-tRNA synthetase
VKNIASLERQLGDAKFLAGAPGHVVEGMRKKLEDYRAQLAKLDGAV